MNLSYTKLKTFSDCRLKYRYGYIERLPRPPITSLTFQKRIHAALKQYTHFARKDGVVETEGLLDALAHVYDLKSNPDARNSKEYLESEGILRRYAERENRLKRLPTHTEQVVRMSFGPFNLSGVIDRIDIRDDNRFSVVDYKLDRIVPEGEGGPGARQLGFYQLLVEEGLGLPVADVRLYYLRQGEEKVFPANRATLKETVAWVDTTCGSIQQEKQWKPTPGIGCATCPYKNVCPAKTGKERPLQGVWQQGNLLTEMEGGEES